MDINDDNHGLIFLIQSYSVRDGPGIRTTVFMKGCPLRCPWCQNPESWNAFPELMTHDAKCIGCGKCAEICPVDAIIFNPEDGRRIDRDLCNCCFDCVATCPAGALDKVGEMMTVKQVMREIEKDEAFISRSDGGVTVSGGEPLLQGPFVKQLLKTCRDTGYHTALDTCGFAPWPLLEEIMEYVDLLLYDIKHTDPKTHEKVIGVSNESILENLYKIPDHVKIWLRIPLITGFNDSIDIIEQIGTLGKEIGAEKISILPFNRFGEGKYHNLGNKQSLLEVEEPAREKINKVREQLEDLGLKVTLWD
ncbi:glycyl-radical enzyme activating protein [Thermodesulfobacteriota bacterium]